VNVLQKSAALNGLQDVVIPNLVLIQLLLLVILLIVLVDSKAHVKESELILALNELFL